MTRFRATIAILALLALALAFQGSRGLWEPDEGRYAGIASHMLSSGDFIHPAFNDELRHYAKPPLTYWSIAAGIAALGANEWGARLANALAFAATVLLVLALGRTWTPRRPWLAPLVYASFAMPYSASNALTPDTLLTLFETLGVLGFVRHREALARGARSGARLLMWLGFGLAFLTKGPPGLLPLLAILVFCALEKGWRGIAQLASTGGLALFAAVGLGWFALVVATEPGLVTYFLHDEVVNRIFTGAHHRNSAWYGAIKVYVPTLLLGSLPWSWILLRAAISAPRTALSRDWWRRKLRDDPWPAFLAVWLLLPLAVFFLSRSRLPLYVLPLFPPLALLIARGLEHWRPSRLTLALIACWLAGLVGLRAAAAHYSTDSDSRRLAQAILARQSPAPSEVLFVDATPHWGLTVYLQCEVKRVRLGGGESAAAAGSDNSLGSEMASLKPPRPLIIARPERRQAVAAELARLGYEPLELGQAGRWTLLAPGVRTAPGGPEHKIDPEKKI
ncbi:MAG TPA: glycosyltransferase family 39 protein [Burkholderiales bacterium]|nr:glycosyltransferase family 39 protein [Burkholderiales bacterium]